MTGHLQSMGHRKKLNWLMYGLVLGLVLGMVVVYSNKCRMMSLTNDKCHQIYVSICFIMSQTKSHKKPKSGLTQSKADLIRIKLWSLLILVEGCNFGLCFWFVLICFDIDCDIGCLAGVPKTVQRWWSHLQICDLLWILATCIEFNFFSDAP